MNKLTAASLKLHMFGVFVLQTLHAEGKLPEDFDPMSLDASIVTKFDPNEMKNLFKTNKKAKTNVKVVSSPRENVVGVIANNHYESSDMNQTDDVVMQIVNAAKSDVAEKPKRKPRQKKAIVESEVAETTEPAVNADATEPVVVENKPKKKSPPKKKAAPVEPVAAVESTESVAADETTETVVAENKPKKKSPSKKKAAHVEPVAAVESTETVAAVESTESVAAAETTETVVAEEKPKKKSPPKKNAAPVEPVASTETTNESVVAEEKPKKKSPPKKKAAPVEPVAAESAEPVVEATVTNSTKKTAAINAVNTLLASTVVSEEKEETYIEEPIAENKVEDNVVKVIDVHTDESEAQEDDDEDEEEEEIQARIMNYEGKQYLIDDKKTVYDKESFDELGTFDENTQKIIFN